MPTGTGLGVFAKGKHMKHVIADKLNFLMKVTGTKNNMLGRGDAVQRHVARSPVLHKGAEPIFRLLRIPGRLHKKRSPAGRNPGEAATVYY